MKVELLSYTRDAAELCATAAHTCYSEDAHESIYDLSQGKITRILDETVESGHQSVIEHSVYTFNLIGISRACSLQLVRHRMASYSQQSQRYVNMEKANYVTPKSIDDSVCIKDYPHNISKKEMFEDAMISCWCAYRALIDSGVPEEDARYVLPNACTTNIVVTMNARELMHFFELRMCNRAQSEIREVANEMYNHCMRVSPKIFKYAGPRCWTEGCREKKPCGNPPKKEI